MPDINLFTRYVVRSKLSKLVGDDHELVKYFENFFKDISQTLPDYTQSVEEIALVAQAQASQVAALSDEIVSLKAHLQNQTVSANDIQQLQSQFSGVITEFQSGLDAIENALTNAQARALQLLEDPKKETITGTAILSAGIATVYYPITLANRIFLTSQVDGGAVGFLRITAKVPGVSFTITSSSATDSSTVGYLIV